MGRALHPLTLPVLQFINDNTAVTSERLRGHFFPAGKTKQFYNFTFRLIQQGLLIKKDQRFELTNVGRQALEEKKLVRDGVWKLVLYDIPETKKDVRAILRGKLKFLGFKKWQNSIWASPYALPAGVEKELNELSKRYFIRLLKLKDINRTDDLEALF